MLLTIAVSACRSTSLRGTFAIAAALQVDARWRTVGSYPAPMDRTVVGDKLLTGRFLVLCGGSLAYFLALGSTWPVVPSFVEHDLGGGGLAVGLSVGAFGFSAAILRPLIGYDKTESMALARRVGTLKLSEIQCADSCTVFAPSNPATNSTLNVIHKQESRMDVDELLGLALADVTVVNPANGETSPFRFHSTEETPVTSSASSSAP